MTSAVAQAVTIINQIIAMQSPDDQHAVLDDLIKRYDLATHKPKILTDKDVADIYGVHVRTVQEWMIAKDLRAFKEARKWYTRTDWLHEFENNRVKTGRRI